MNCLIRAPVIRCLRVELYAILFYFQLSVIMATRQTPRGHPNRAFRSRQVHSLPFHFLSGVHKSLAHAEQLISITQPSTSSTVLDHGNMDIVNERNHDTKLQAIHPGNNFPIRQNSCQETAAHVQIGILFVRGWNNRYFVKRLSLRKIKHLSSRTQLYKKTCSPFTQKPVLCTRPIPKIKLNENRNQYFWCNMRCWVSYQEMRSSHIRIYIVPVICNKTQLTCQSLAVSLSITNHPLNSSVMTIIFKKNRKQKTHSSENNNYCPKQFTPNRREGRCDCFQVREARLRGSCNNTCCLVPDIPDRYPILAGLLVWVFKHFQ